MKIPIHLFSKCQSVKGIEFIHYREGRYMPVYVAACHPEIGMSIKPLFPEDPFWYTHGVAAEGGNASLCFIVHKMTRKNFKDLEYVLDVLLQIEAPQEIKTSVDFISPIRRQNYKGVSMYSCPF